jgi:site-specific DNA-methyltransferase (adenine-specific)
MSAVPRNQVLVGDVMDRLRELPAASVDCVITSPPYWALRNYQAGGQIGQELSVHGWVEQLVSVCDEIARVLSPEGTLWLNVGDTYSRQDRHGAPPKGLLLGPERLLLALVDREWRVRNKVIWNKSNPMPSSVGDRLSSRWEPVYLLVRSRHYYFDLDPMREPHGSVRPPSRRPPPPFPTAWSGSLAGDQSGLRRLKMAGLPGHPLGKNPGDVWTIPTSNFRGGHFATYPEALVERPIKAGCPERVCTNCDRAWRRQRVARRLGGLATLGTLRPACTCSAPYRPGLVLDPFLGSGTTAVVAERLGRDWLGIELNPDFAAIAERRISEARGNNDTAEAAS